MNRWRLPIQTLSFLVAYVLLRRVDLPLAVVAALVGGVLAGSSPSMIALVKVRWLDAIGAGLLLAGLEYQVTGRNPFADGALHDPWAFSWSLVMIPLTLFTGPAIRLIWDMREALNARIRDGRNA